MKCNEKASVGKSEQPAHIRFNGHHSDAKNTNKLADDPHFLEPGHIFDKDAKFSIIEKFKNTYQRKENLANLLMRRDDFWLETL